MSELELALWIPEEWGTFPSESVCDELEESNVDLLLIPEDHAEWNERDSWIEFATKTSTAIYAGFSDNGWRRAIFYDPKDGFSRIYTKHATADKLAFEEDGWSPESLLSPFNFRGTRLGTTICHDHYFSPLMAYQSASGANVLLNLSATPVKRRKWGEVLQARSIENSAYVFCTMHATKKDGSKPVSNQSHAFGFHPDGQPVMFTELITGNDTPLFETSPGSVYVASVDVSKYDSNTSQLTDIDRIRTNSSDAEYEGRTVLEATSDDGTLTLNFAGEYESIPYGESRNFTLGDRSITVLGLDVEQVEYPERIYTELDFESIEDNVILFNIDARGTTDTYRRNILDPILRSRCVEWCSPLYVSTDNSGYGFHLANTAKDTHRLETRTVGFELNRAWGSKSAFKPSHGHSEPFKIVAEKTLDMRPN